MKLDLHGVKHEDVSNTVKRFLEAALKEDGIGRHEIITGLSMQMQKIVINEVNKYQQFGGYHVPGAISIYIK